MMNENNGQEEILRRSVPADPALDETRVYPPVARSKPFDLSAIDDTDLDAAEPEIAAPVEEAVSASQPSVAEEDIDDVPAFMNTRREERKAEETVETEPELPAQTEELENLVPGTFLTEDEQQEYEQMFKPDTQKREVPVRRQTAQKRRPKRKKGEGLLGIPNILATIVWLAIIVAVGTTLGRMLWVCASDVLAFGREDKVVSVTVYESDTIEDITEKLYKGGLIRYPELFKLYAKFAVDDGEIKPGMWDLNTLYDYHALVRMMSPSSSREVVKVMIPEGYSCRQIFDLLQDNKVCTAKDIASYAASGELDDYWFLEGVERGDKYCLEGFLFPDTYEFYTNDKPRNVLEKMLNNFNNRFSEEMQGQISILNDHISAMMRSDGRGEDYISSHQLSIRDIVIVASMVERETANTEESYTIASVIYNRLYAWGSTPAFLNIDAAIVYALDGKTDLTGEDLKIDSPYNTYTNTGLTPGPIANPGLSSLKAALSPAESNYYFYVLDPSIGAHHFSRTLEEHEAFRQSLRG